MPLPFLLGLLGAAGTALGGAMGTRGISNALDTKLAQYPKTTLTPYAEQAAAKYGGWANVANLAKQKLGSATTTYKAPTTSGGGSYGGGYASVPSGSSGIPSYLDALKQGGSYAKDYYDPLREYLKKTEEETYDRYKEYRESQKEQLPLIQQRYQALLDQINANYEAEQEDVAEQEANQLGRQAARAAARGTYGSSVMEGQEQMISRAAMAALNTLAEEQRGKTQELSGARGLEEKGVYNIMNQIDLAGEERGQDLIRELLGLAPMELEAAMGIGGGIVDTGAKQADALIRAYTASKGSTGVNTSYKTLRNPTTGNYEEALVDDRTGDVIKWVGQAETSLPLQLQQAIANASADGLTTDEIIQLQQLYPTYYDKLEALKPQEEAASMGWLDKLRNWNYNRLTGQS